jgi:hypothetical protein
MVSSSRSPNSNEFNLMTRALAGFCHGCGICPYAASNPGSALDRLMSWHRTWCPAWSAHTRVYGKKSLR